MNSEFDLFKTNPDLYKRVVLDLATYNGWIKVATQLSIKKQYRRTITCRFIDDISLEGNVKASCERFLREVSHIVSLEEFVEALQRAYFMSLASEIRKAMEDSRTVAIPSSQLAPHMQLRNCAAVQSPPPAAVQQAASRQSDVIPVVVSTKRIADILNLFLTEDIVMAIASLEEENGRPGWERFVRAVCKRKPNLNGRDAEEDSRLMCRDIKISCTSLERCADRIVNTVREWGMTVDDFADCLIEVALPKVADQVLRA